MITLGHPFGKKAAPNFFPLPYPSRRSAKVCMSPFAEREDVGGSAVCLLVKIASPAKKRRGCFEFLGFFTIFA